MSITKLFVRLRESGEVLEVEESLHSAMGVRPDAWIYFHTLDETCDLCDEQGRLLVAQDKEMFEKLESLSNRYEVIDGQYVIRKQNLDALIYELKEATK